MRILAIALLMFLLAAYGSAFAVTSRVPSQFSSIQAALDHCLIEHADTILVASGTYEIAPGAQRIATVQNLTNITIISENGKESTTLIGPNTGADGLIVFWHSTDCTLEGFTVSNGYGRGIRISICSDIKIANCNIGHTAGGIGIDIDPECSTVEISNNLISENDFGVVSAGNNVLLSHNKISDNAWTGIECSGSGVAVILANEICDNHGPGLNITDVSTTANVTIESNIIYGNGDSGLRYAIPGSSLVRNNTISRNGFDGIYILRGAPNIQHNIIASNDGAGIAVDQQGNPYISCNDVWGNSHYANGNYVGYITDQTGYNGNISADPYFCGAASHNYSLASNSPALLQGCGPMGAILIPGCSNQTAVEHLSWGSIKALYK